MRRLLLLRHAKSSWDSADLDDADRPLAPRGERAAPKIGRYLSETGLRPDLVLCSSAVRTLQTWELVAAAMAPEAPPPRCEIRRPLYQASPSDLLEAVQRVGDEVRSLMLIGHNPGIGRLALRLAGDGDQAQLARIAKKFPTGALAVISFGDGNWADLGFGAGRLVDYVTPKELD